MRDSAIVKTHELGDYWQSTIDQSYICQVGEEGFFKDHGITHFIQHHRSLRDRADIGFNPLAQKWYTWTSDQKEVWSFGVDELKDSDVPKSQWTSFGFKGAMERVKQIAASHSLIGGSS